MLGGMSNAPEHFGDENVDSSKSVARTWLDLDGDVPFTPEALLADVERLRGNREVLAVYVAGSKVDGYGNARSDVDAYALVRSGELLHEHDGFDVTFIERQHIQFDFVPVEFVEQALQQIETNPPDRVLLVAREMLLLHRLYNSVAVSGSDIIEGFRTRLRNANFAHVCAAKQITACENTVQDLYGAWESGQSETSVYAARIASQYAFDAVVSLLGETANNGKWIFPRSARSLGVEHPACKEFRAIYSSAPLGASTDAISAYLRRCLRMVQVGMETFLAHLLVGPDAVHKHFELNNLADQLLLGGMEPVPQRKSEEAYVRRESGKLYLYVRGIARQELSERAAVCWLSIAGRKDNSACAATAHSARPDLFADEADAHQRMSKLAAGWREKGLLYWDDAANIGCVDR